MELQDLHREIYLCCKREIHNKRDSIVEDAKQLMPMIQEFTKIVAEPNNFDMTIEEYRALRQYYFDILNDLISGIENRDCVLTYDALGYGLLEFVALFLPEGEWEKL